MHPYGSTPPPARSRRRWWIWGCGGCGALALVVIAVVVAVSISTFINSPLRHFPEEAGASTAHDSFQVVNGRSSETMVIDDPHALTDVESFYQAALHGGGWTVDAADAARATSGDNWHFSRSNSPSQSGLLTFVTIGTATRITVEYEY